MSPDRPIYLDCNATTPPDRRVCEVVRHWTEFEFGNAGSRTHEYGARAKQAVEQARDHVANLVGCTRQDVIFTSGATESNNLAILGLAPHGVTSGRKHVISTQIEHKSVLEPLEALRRRGFDVTLLPPTPGGWIEPDELRRALRPETLLVTIMHVNNETGVIQDMPAFAEVLADHPAYLHTDAAQSFGKAIPGLENPRVDMLSASAHKVYGPKGVGALVARGRGFKRPPLEPLTFGGGQERGLRPGTLPVPLVVGFGKACELARQEAPGRQKTCRRYKEELMAALSPLCPTVNGDPARTVTHTVNLSFEGVDSEALMVALKDELALSNGSACTSHSYSPSHVLSAMCLSDARLASAVRLSWCHETRKPDWEILTPQLHALR